MKKEKQRIRFMCKVFIGTIFISTLLLGCSKEKDVHTMIKETSIFSWEEEYLYPEQEEQLNQIMRTLECGAIYQEISEDVDEKIIQGYLNRRSENQQDVYYLAGKKEWGIEKSGESMLQSVKHVANLNAKMKKDTGFAGIVFDVEPYLLEEWDQNRKIVMEQFVDNSIQAYKEAKKENLIVILCIPNFYDQLGLSKELNRLVASGCDAIAVMNYNKTDEAGQMLEETNMAEYYEKGILHITEMQKPGVHDLTENNTYYYDGVEAVQKSWENIKAELDYENLGFSWHYLKPLQELLGRGNTQ